MLLAVGQTHGLDDRPITDGPARTGVDPEDVKPVSPASPWRNVEGKSMRHEACSRLTGMSALKILLIISVLVAGVVILPLCGSGIGAGCTHIPCARSRPNRRLAHRLKSVCRWLMGLWLPVTTLAPLEHTSSASLVSTPALLELSALRI
jgi:hypothetical protein